MDKFFKSLLLAAAVFGIFGFIFLFNVVEINAETTETCCQCGDGTRQSMSGDHTCRDLEGATCYNHGDGSEISCDAPADSGSDSDDPSNECGALAEGDNEWARERLEQAEEADRGIFTEGLSDECMAFGCCGTCDILVVISNVFQFALSIVGILAVLVLVIAGIMYVTSGGNQEQVGKAKAALTAAVVGTVIVLAAWLIINAILSAAGYSDSGSWFSPSC